MRALISVFVYTFDFCDKFKHFLTLETCKICAAAPFEVLIGGLFYVFCVISHYQ